MGLDGRPLNPSPGLSQKLNLRRNRIARRQVSIQVITAHGNSLSDAWREQFISTSRQRRSAGSSSTRSGGRRLGGGGRRDGGEARIEPAGVHPAIQAVLGLGVERALPHKTAESGLDMRVWAAEPVVKVEVAEGGIEVVPPHQADHPAAEPDAFRVAGRPDEQARRLSDLVDALLAFLGGVAGRFLLFGRLQVAALGERRSGGKTQGCQAERSTQYAQLGY